MPSQDKNYPDIRPMEQLGKQLRQLRQQRGLTQREVAQHLRLERSTYSYYECGKSEPDLYTLFRLSQLYEVSIDSMLKVFKNII